MGFDPGEGCGVICEGVEQKRRRASCNIKTSEKKGAARTTLRDAMCVWESSQQAARENSIVTFKTVKKEHKKPKKMIGRAA